MACCSHAGILRREMRVIEFDIADRYFATISRLPMISRLFAASAPASHRFAPHRLPTTSRKRSYHYRPSFLTKQPRIAYRSRPRKRGYARMLGLLFLRAPRSSPFRTSASPARRRRRSPSRRLSRLRYPSMGRTAHYSRAHLEAIQTSFTHFTPPTRSTLLDYAA